MKTIDNAIMSGIKDLLFEICVLTIIFTLMGSGLYNLKGLLAYF